MIGADRADGFTRLSQTSQTGAVMSCTPSVANLYGGGNSRTARHTCRSSDPTVLLTQGTASFPRAQVKWQDKQWSDHIENSGERKGQREEIIESVSQGLASGIRRHHHHPQLSTLENPPENPSAASPTMILGYSYLTPCFEPCL